MLKARKANRVIIVSDDKQDEYLALGYTITDMSGKIIREPRNTKKEIEGLEKEIEELKMKLEESKKEVDELKKANKELLRENEEFKNPVKSGKKAE